MPTLSGAYSAVGGKRDCFGMILGYTHVESMPMVDEPAVANQFGQVFGAGFVNASGYFAGAVKKS